MIYTRKQAHEDIRVSGKTHGFHIFDIDKLIDRVFDRLDKQICSNCVHDHCGCSVQDSILQVDSEATFYTFGCNSFEAASKRNNPTNFDEAVPKAYDNPFKDL